MSSEPKVSQNCEEEDMATNAGKIVVGVGFLSMLKVGFCVGFVLTFARDSCFSCDYVTFVFDSSSK